MHNNSSQIQSLLDNIKNEVSVSNESCDTIDFFDFWNEKYHADDINFDKRAFLNDVTQLEIHNQTSYYKELTSFKNGPAKFVKAFKRVIRKSVAFLFLPLIAEQNDVNANVSRIAVYLRAYINRDTTNQYSAIKKVKELETKVDMQNDVIKELADTIEKLNAKINNIQKDKEGI